MWTLNGVTHVKHLEQCLACGNHLILPIIANMLLPLKIQMHFSYEQIVSLWSETGILKTVLEQNINDGEKGESLLGRDWFVAKQPHADRNGPSSVLQVDSQVRAGHGLQPYSVINRLCNPGASENISHPQPPYLLLIVWFLGYPSPLTIAYWLSNTCHCSNFSLSAPLRTDEQETPLLAC